MAEALISVVLERLISVGQQQIRDGVHLVRGVDDEIQSLTRTLRSLQSVLEDAELRQVKDSSIQVWLEELKDMAYQMDDVVDEWSISLLRLQMEDARASTSKKKKVSGRLLFPFSCLKQLASRRDIALKIQSIQKQLDAIDRDRNRFQFAPTRIEKPQHPVTTSGIDISEVRGREMDVQTIIGRLLGQNSEQRPGRPDIISIVGAGGMGKTTLAQLAFKHPEVAANFDARIWVCVSDPFEPRTIFRHIIETLKEEPSKFDSLEALQKEVEKQISAKKLLLVLDDVWTEDYGLWEQVKNSLSCGALGSKILLTTRKESVVQVIRSNYKHQLGELSQEESQALFNQIAFYGKTSEEEEALKAIGEKITDKCKGLPLAIKTLGNLMRFKNRIEKWEAVMNNEVWELDAFQNDISPALWLSYHDLPSAIKRCFSFCAVFPKDYKFHRDELIRLWMAHNYLGSKEPEMVGRDYFEYLAATSFFQDFKKDDFGNIVECKMHDIVHNFAQFLTKNECMIVESDKPIDRNKEKIRHATLIVHSDVEAIVSSPFMKNLHTLSLSCQDSFEFMSPSFQNYTCLRALKLEARDLNTFPKEIGKLIHLRYLDLSGCWRLRELPEIWRLRELPETICNLYNLQTLNIWGCCTLKKLPQTMGKLIHLRYLNLSWCRRLLYELSETICNLYNLQTLNIMRCVNLKNLPQAIGKLINLRHLNNRSSGLEGLPKGILKSSCLWTLDEFIVSRGGDDECKISDLRNLSKLRGFLEIKVLDEVEDAREAEEAQLEKMTHLRSLTLNFGYKSNKAVEDALKTPLELKKLKIRSYVDVELPSWLVNSSLTHLKFLVLLRLIECSRMPPLGELPLLESLKIIDMKKVQYVGDEFLGSSSTIAFPRLKKLSFIHMESWEKWEVKERSVMPSLSFLQVDTCLKLEGLPDNVLQISTLQELKIVGCPILKQRYEKDERISHIPTTIFKDRYTIYCGFPHPSET